MSSLRFSLTLQLGPKFKELSVVWNCTYFFCFLTVLGTTTAAFSLSRWSSLRKKKKTKGKRSYSVLKQT